MPAPFLLLTSLFLLTSAALAAPAPQSGAAPASADAGEAAAPPASREQPANAAAVDAATADEAAPTLRLQPLAAVAVYPQYSAAATVTSRNETRLAAETTARIVALPVDVGETLRRGETALRLDERDAALALARAAAALAQAQARAALAEAQLERARALHQQQFMSAQMLELRQTEAGVAAADVRAAAAQRDTAQRALAKHVLRAPFDAVVRARQAQLGELATPGAPLLTLVQIDAVELQAQLQPQHAAMLRAGAAVRFEALGVSHELRLLRVSPLLEKSSRSFDARFAFTATPPPIGLPGRLVWRDPRPHAPSELVVKREGVYGVFIAAAGVLRLHPLAQAQEGRPALVDLPLEALIVSRGQHALRDGDPAP